MVWTQGCSLRCLGCSNPLAHPHTPRIMVEPRRLARGILGVPGIEGMTVTGGEPFEQAAAVATLCCTVREGGLSTMVFTGWSLEFLRSSPCAAVRGLLEQVDLLVDDPFVQHLADSTLLWRGSANQRVRFLTTRYGPEILEERPHPEVEARFGGSDALGITGFPTREDLESLTRHLREDEGIVLERDAC